MRAGVGGVRRRTAGRGQQGRTRGHPRPRLRLVVTPEDSHSPRHPPCQIRSGFATRIGFAICVVRFTWGNTTTNNRVNAAVIHRLL